MLKTQEHIHLITQFERFHHKNRVGRLDKEEKSAWPSGHIYQDGVVNQTFLAYREGYAYGKVIGSESAEAPEAQS